MAVAQPVTPAPLASARAERSPGAIAVAALVAISLIVGLVLLYLLWEFWPTEGILKSAAAQPVHVFGIHRLVSPEIRLLVVVALAGALGGLMHSTRSLADYVGHQALLWRWVPYYLVTIVIGAGLATILYLLIRGGVLGGKATTADTNPYGFAALGALVGLFTEQALEMLRRVASEVFSNVSPKADALTTTTTTSGAGEAALAAKSGTASNVTASSATLEGDATAVGQQTSYHFDYGTTNAYGQITPTQVADETAQQPIHVTADVNGLSPGTEYHFRLVVADASGSWTTGDDATFTTPAG